MGNLNPIYENKYYFICLCLSIPAFNEENYNTAQVTEVSNSPKSKVRNQYIHPDQGYWMNDSLSILPGFGKITIKKLQDYIIS